MNPFVPFYEFLIIDDVQSNLHHAFLAHLLLAETNHGHFFSNSTIWSALKGTTKPLSSVCATINQYDH